MGKRIWIFNHYAVPDGYQGEKRHFKFARVLREAGYDPIIFSSSFLHGTDTDMLDGVAGDHLVREYDGVEFVFVRTRRYQGNGLDRIKGMLDYYRAVRRLSGKFERPDIVYASSPHPLALLAAIKVSRRFRVRSICEVRDLWPESFVAYGMIAQSNPVLKILYSIEHYLYRECDALVFTMPHGSDYPVEKGWRDVDPAKISNINNGIDLASYDALCRVSSADVQRITEAPGLSLVYCGTIAKTHNLLPLIQALDHLHQEGVKDVNFFVFGDGEQRGELEQYCEIHEIDLVHFMGTIEHDLVPGVMRAADVNVVSVASSELSRFGPSWLKMPECLAAGKPILMTSCFPYNPIIESGSGVQADGTVSGIKCEIERLRLLEKREYDEMCANALAEARKYDIRELASSLIRVIEG